MTDAGAAPTPPRRGLALAVTAVAGLVCCAGIAVAAYLYGAANRGGETATKGTGDPPPAAPAPDRLVPTPDEAAFTPAGAAGQIGKVCTVEYQVAKTGGVVTAHLALNSTDDAKNPNNFSARIASDIIEPGSRAEVAKQYEGKTVRVRGKLHKDQFGTTSIEVRDFDQLLIVSPR